MEDYADSHHPHNAEKYFGTGHPLMNVVEDDQEAVDRTSCRYVDYLTIRKSVTMRDW